MRARQAASKGSGARVFKGPVVKVQMPKELVDGCGRFAGIDDLIAALPTNYSFEVKKSVWRLLESKCRVSAPEVQARGAHGASGGGTPVP